MDPLLFERYAALFRGYGSFARRFGVRDFLIDVRDYGILSYIKGRLAEELERGKLRPDAALFLLTCYDQMILRAYAVEIPFTRFPPHDLGRDTGNFRQRVEQSLNLILGEARRRRDAQVRQTSQDEMLSSHELLRAIDAVWPDLSIMFGWG